MQNARPAISPAPQASHTDRLRAGLTGLGLVVVVVVLTAADVRPAPAPKAQAPEGETLAVLGVAPSSDVSAETAGTAPRADAR
jgi:hypothetical protein